MCCKLPWSSVNCPGTGCLELSKKKEWVPTSTPSPCRRGDLRGHGAMQWVPALHRAQAQWAAPTPEVPHICVTTRGDTALRGRASHIYLQELRPSAAVHVFSEGVLPLLLMVASFNWKTLFASIRALICRMIVTVTLQLSSKKPPPALLLLLAPAPVPDPTSHPSATAIRVSPATQIAERLALKPPPDTDIFLDIYGPPEQLSNMPANINSPENEHSQDR